MVPLFLVQVLVLLVPPLLLWRFAGLNRLAPLGVIQICFGVALGPGVLGGLAPHVQAALFPPSSLSTLQGLAVLAVCLFTFTTGMHLDMAGLRRALGATGMAGPASFLGPLLGGMVLGGVILVVAPEAMGPAGNGLMFALAIGICCSVTALPILAEILRELGILTTPFGERALALAAINDAALWLLLSAVLLVIGAGHHAHSLAPLLAAPAAAAAAWLVPALLWRALWTEEADPAAAAERPLPLMLAVALALATCLVTEVAGLGYVIGAFLAGLVMPTPLRQPLQRRLGWTVMFVLMPFFFALTGLRTDFDLASPLFIGTFVTATLVAVASKVAAVFPTARAAGLPAAEALALGALMQTKGLMEVIVLTILIDAGVIGAEIFAALVMMALVCTVLPMPMVAALLGLRPGKALLTGRT